jgi:hypothetical protein
MCVANMINNKYGKKKRRYPSLLFLFFLQHWGSNPRPHKFSASSLTLSPRPKRYSYTKSPYKMDASGSFL